MKKRTARRAWNGGTQEAAAEYARKMTATMVEQGATICGRCAGEGLYIADRGGICSACRGAGAIIPQEGLRMKGDANE